MFRGELIILKQWRIFKGCLNPFFLLQYGWTWKWAIWMGDLTWVE